MVIDISKWNGVIDWVKLKKNKEPIELVIIKATQGTDSTDKMFLQNAKALIANGIPWGAYHFALFKTDDVSKYATEQAYHFIKTVKVAGAAPSVMVLDTETNETKLPINANKLETFCSIFLSILEKEGFNVAIYMSPGFSWFFPTKHKLGRHKLWVADYTGSINTINGWTKPWLHQYTDKGKIAGINTNVDLNKFL